MRECKKNGIKPHPARFPRKFPEFFIKFLTDLGDLVVDPFAGSNTTGYVSEYLERQWLAFEIEESYIQASHFRFGLDSYHSDFEDRDKDTGAQLRLYSASEDYGDS